MITLTRLKRVLLTAIALFACACEVEAVNVRGYYRKDGTYVRPHTRSSPSRSSSFRPESSSGPSYSYYLPQARTAPPLPRDNTPRRSARTTASGFGTIGSGSIDARDAASGQSLSAKNPKSEAAKLRAADEAQEHLARGESYELSKQYYESLREFDKVRRSWPETKAGALAREHILRIRANEPYRTWTDISGKHEVVARFIREENHAVMLQTQDGKNVRIEFVKLSAHDKIYVIMRQQPL